MPYGTKPCLNYMNFMNGLPWAIRNMNTCFVRGHVRHSSSVAGWGWRMGSPFIILSDIGFYYDYFSSHLCMKQGPRSPAIIATTWKP